MDNFILILHKSGEIITEYFSNEKAAFEKMNKEYNETLEDYLESYDSEDLSHGTTVDEAWINDGHESYAWALEKVRWVA